MNLFDALLRMRSYAPNGPHPDWADRIDEEINTLSAANDWSKGEIERLKVLLSHWRECWADGCNPDGDVIDDTDAALDKESAT
jgi:hypothetical protein